MDLKNVEEQRKKILDWINPKIIINKNFRAIFFTNDSFIPSAGSNESLKCYCLLSL